jgi:hypothetical protein
LVAPRLGAGQHDAGALRQGLADVPAPDQVRQRRPLRVRQLERDSLGSACHGSLPRESRQHPPEPEKLQPDP